MECIFVLPCGRNPGACCYDCELECSGRCVVNREECEHYVDSIDRNNGDNFNSLYS